MSWSALGCVISNVFELVSDVGNWSEFVRDCLRSTALVLVFLSWF